MGKGAALSNGVVKKIILSYTYVALWIFLSFTVIVYNKYILDRKLYGWPFPISLAMIHMTFCSSLAFLLVRVFKVVEPVSFSWNVYLTCILPIGALYSFEATRLVMIQILLTSKGIILNPITSLYYVAPSCLVFLSIPWIFVELPILRQSSRFQFDFAIFGTYSLCAFALNLAVFLLVGKTSALTMNVAGVVKDWLLIAFSWSVIKDTVTPVNLIGYGLAFLGVAYYNHKKSQAKKSQQADDEARRLLLERDSNGSSDSQA
ncbi:hypothetical protein KY285_020974 [Solanum tuberosum]|nr:hypothetical protein KY285_020974 [Solanum tuberosum]